MSITTYEKDGLTFWQVYVDLRSRKDRRIRVQQRINGLQSEREALFEERKLTRELIGRLNKLESGGARWVEVVERWVRQHQLHPSASMSQTTLIDYEAVLRNWTKPWLERTASEITRADARELFNRYEVEEKTRSFRKRLKTVINKVYLWGIDERLISGVQRSPAAEIELAKGRGETRPEILSSDQIRYLLKKAHEQNHPWYPIWVSAVLTGCRSGELHQLKRSDIEIVTVDIAVEQEKLPPEKRRYGFISVRRSWNTRFKKVGPTKAGYWRNVPVSSEFYRFLVCELKVNKKRPDDFVLPRFWEWDKGEQARVLRAFCLGNFLPSIKFHTLRACFSTQLISSGVPPTVVMKICGWKDLKTMQRYIRLAGIDEAGATESLKFIPNEIAAVEEVVKELFGKVRS